MKIIDYKEIDVINGPGTRVSVWFAGCDHMCKGCFSQHTWKWEGQTADEINLYERIERDMTDSRIKRDGISLLGGDPLYTLNLTGLIEFLKWFKEHFPEKTVWLWSGYTYDECLLHKERHDIIKLVDVLVDGKFVQEQKDPSLLWRGSANQRIIDVRNV